MSIEWIVIRGSGLVAFALLATASIWGLLISTKLLGKLGKLKALTFFHEALGLGALLATAVHMVALALDEYIHFGAVELLVPGVSEWRPLPVALGVMAAYTVLIVSLSFYFKKWIGLKTWRAIHFFSFGGFLAALIHGITAGSDTAHPAVLGMYLVSTSLLFGLLALRLLAGSGQPARPAQPARSAQPGPGSVPASPPAETTASRGR